AESAESQPNRLIGSTPRRRPRGAIDLSPRRAGRDGHAGSLDPSPCTGGAAMQLCKVQTGAGETRVGALAEGPVRFLNLEGYVGLHSLSDILHADDPAALAHDLIDDGARNIPVGHLTLLAPIDRQEVWAAGVTYKRSRQARERESAGAGGASFYDK